MKIVHIEVYRVDPNCDWLEVRVTDQLNPSPTNIHLVINDAKDMVHLFRRRYLAKQTQEFAIPEKTIASLEDFFQEAYHVKIMKQADQVSDDMMKLLRTNCIDFSSPEKSSFRKSKAARIKLFLDQVYEMIDLRDFEKAIKWLDWIHILEASHELGFELKIVCLRSWKKVPECVPVFETWIQTHPQKSEPRLGLGELWLYLDQNKRALETFEALLEIHPNHPMALIGLAQAKARLGEDFVPQLMKTAVVDPGYTRDMVENHFDFRHLHPGDLEPKTLQEIAAQYNMPMKRLIDRAMTGVLPYHSPLGDGLLRFSKVELDRYYEVLKRLGLEISTAGLEKDDPHSKPSAEQLDLFNSPE